MRHPEASGNTVTAGCAPKAGAPEKVTQMPHMNVDELASDSRVSKHTWRLWIRQGRIPVVRLGRRILVDEADYRRFLADNRVEARAEVRRPA